MRKEEIIQDIERKSLSGFLGIGIHLALSVFNMVIMATGNIVAILIIIPKPDWLMLKLDLDHQARLKRLSVKFVRKFTFATIKASI